MQQSLSVVLERGARLSGSFTTEPYEVAWAREARWFVRVLRTEGDDTTLSSTTQISPDGLHWCDLEDSGGTLEGRGLISWPAREFGGWLRIKGTFDGAGGEGVAKVLIHLVLKSCACPSRILTFDHADRRLTSTWNISVRSTRWH